MIELIPPREAARQLHVSTDQLAGFVHDGELKYVNVGRGQKRPRMMFTQQDLDEFIERRTRRQSQWRPSTRARTRGTSRPTSGSAGKNIVDLRSAQIAERRKEAARRLELELAQQVEVEAAAGASFQLGDVAARYMVDIGDHHVGAENTDRLVRLLIKHFGATKLLTEITHDDALVLRRWRRGHKVGKGENARPISAYTVNDTIEQLKKLFTYLRPTVKVFPQEPKWRDLWLDEPREHERELSRAEAVRLDTTIPECRDDYWPLIEFIRLTGKRKTNCIERSWPQIDWDREIIELKGKGRGGGKPISIKITPAIRALLWPLRGQHPERVFTFVAQRTMDKVIKGRRYCFVKGERYPITKDGLRRVWGTICAAAELQFRIHDLRHDFATKLLRQTRNLKLVAKALDHSSTKITERYAHVLDEEVADAMEELATTRMQTRNRNHRRNHRSAPLKEVKVR
jgi:integrase